MGPKMLTYDKLTARVHASAMELITTFAFLIKGKRYIAWFYLTYIKALLTTTIQ